jgi:hypothetical protein
VVIDMLDNNASPSAVWTQIKHRVDSDAQNSSHSTHCTSATHANPLCMDHHDAVAPDGASATHVAASASSSSSPPPFHNSFAEDAQGVACSLTDDPDARLGSIAELHTPRCDEQHELYTPRTEEEQQDEGGGGHAPPPAFDVTQLGSPYTHDAAAFLHQVAKGTAQFFPHATASSSCPSSPAASASASPPPPGATAAGIAAPSLPPSPSPPPACSYSASVDAAGGVGILALSPSIDRLFRKLSAADLNLTEESRGDQSTAPPAPRPQQQRPNSDSASLSAVCERRPPLPTAARGNSPQEPMRLRTAATLSRTLPAAAPAATPGCFAEAAHELEAQRSDCLVESAVEPPVDEEEMVLGRRRTLAMRPIAAALSTGSPSESPRPPLFLQVSGTLLLPPACWHTLRWLREAAARCHECGGIPAHRSLDQTRFI